nr:hypothetical protein CPGR_02247 [Mycolicibacter nonchromogenicus]
MHLSTTASSTGSEYTRRIARWVIMASANGISSRDNASAVVGTWL